MSGPNADDKTLSAFVDEGGHAVSIPTEVQGVIAHERIVKAFVVGEADEAEVMNVLGMLVLRGLDSAAAASDEHLLDGPHS